MADFEVLPPGHQLPPGQRPPENRTPPGFGHPPSYPPNPGPPFGSGPTGDQPPGSYDPRQPPRAQGQKKGLAGIGAAILIAIAKFKFLAFAALKTGLSMFLMIWVYSWLYGWPFAIGFVILILVHEMGHVIAAKLLGMPVSAPLFIPFVGAAIFLKDNPRDAWSEALMAYGGPLAGTVGGWICYWIAVQLSAPWLMAVASATFVINLFNLIPVPPLDGGRICAAVSTWFWLLGLVMLGVALFAFHGGASTFIIVLILIYAWPRIVQTFRDRSTPQMQAYYATHPADRFSMAMFYLGLIALALYGYWRANAFLHPTY